MALPLSLFVFVATAHAQRLVPAGGMSAGCPETWHHRDASPTSFSCRDTMTGAFCNGDYRAAAGATLADEARAAHAEILGRGFVIQREYDEGDMHAIVYDDAAGHRIVQFVRSLISRAIIVTCGSDSSTFDAQIPLFSSVAHTAH